MLEFSTSRSQQAVAKWHGRFICSSVDPLQEARQWVTKQAGRVRGLKQVIVLGAGCGYHLARLQTEYPEQRILVIEAQSELIEISKRENALELNDVQFLNISNLESFTKNSKVLRFIRGEYTVLKFAPALITADAFYRSVEDLLLGRTAAGFRFLLAQRPDLQNLFATDRVFSSGAGLISIKNIETALQPGSEGNSGLVVKALRELIN